MNLVGKIFVVLILIASTVFMTMGLMVYATHMNWYEAIVSTNPSKPGWQEQLTHVREEEGKLHAEIEKYKAAIAAEQALKDASVAKAETELTVLREKETKLVEDVKASSIQLDTNSKALSAEQANLTAARAENEKLREDIRVALKQVDEQLKKATELEDKLHIAVVQGDELKKRNDQLANQVAKATQLLSSVGMTIETPVNHQPPAVMGRILAVDKNDRAEISLGSDDGLLEGNTLDIARGDKYLGRMQIVEVHPHRAIGAILPQFKRDVVRKDDEVATKL